MADVELDPQAATSSRLALFVGQLSGECQFLWAQLELDDHGSKGSRAEDQGDASPAGAVAVMV